MIILCLLLVILSDLTCVSSEDLLKLQYPLYGLSEVAAKEYARDKTSCNNQLKSLFYGIQKRERWALKMLGASGAPVSGFVWGNNYWLGARSQCQFTSTRKEFAHSSQAVDGIQPFKVAFYIGQFKERVPEVSEISGGSIHLGLCLPSICSESELKPLLVQWTNQNPLAGQNLYNFTLEYQNVRIIQSSFSWIFSSTTIGLGIALGIVTLLTITGTLYEIYIWAPIKNKADQDNTNNSKNDFYNQNNRNIKEHSNLLKPDNNLNESCELKIDNSHHKSMPIHAFKENTKTANEKSKQNKLAKMVICFSIKSNLKRFLNESVINEELSIAYGLRFFGLAWLIWLRLAHLVKSYWGNESSFYSFPKIPSETILMDSTFAFDVIFFTGGFLLAYKYLKNHTDSLKLEQSFSIKKKVNELSLITMRRLIRLTPVYLIVISIAIVCVKISRQTSLFEVPEESDDLCQKWWWRNVAYINNFFEAKEMCLSWSWYMSTDMQFHFLGLILLILSTRFRKFISVGSLFLVILSFLLTGYYGYRYFFGVESRSGIFHFLHISPWTRIGSYLMGMFTGYFIVQLKGKFLLKRTILFICWVVALVCLVWSLSGMNKNASYVSATIHAALGRIAWTFCLTWVVIACCTNNAGILKPVLSFSAWTSFDKLFYSAYLLSPLILTTIISNFETAIDSNSFPMVVYFFGSSFIIYIYSFVFSLVLEIPLANLIKQFIGHVQIQNQFN